MLLLNFYIEMFEGGWVVVCSLLLSLVKLLYFHDMVGHGSPISNTSTLFCVLAWVYSGREENQEYGEKESEVTYSQQLVLYWQSPCAQPFHPELPCYVTPH